MEEKRERPDMNQMKDLMTCPVCALLFREPKILPCLHSFCTPCLESLVTFDAQQRSSLICPQCRRRVQIPGEGVSTLQTNLFAQNMLTVIALDNSTVNQISCENCISKEAPVSRCNLCRKFLCNFCTTAHRRSRDTVDHPLLSLDDVRSCLPGELAKPLFCNVHKKEKLVLYCESCQSAVCRDCTMMEHRSHKYAFAKEIYSTERSKIAEQLSEARSTGLSLKQGLAAVSKMRANVDERTRSMIKELNDIFTQCMRTINDRYSFLYNQVQNIRNERLLHLDAQKSELEYAFGSIQSSIGFTELTLRNSTQVEVLAMKKYIMDRMKELTGAQHNCIPVADDNIRLTVDNRVMQLLSELGRVEDTNTSPSASIVKGMDTPVIVRQMAGFTVHCYDGRGNPRNKGGDRIVVTVQAADDTSLLIKTEKCFQAQVVDRQNGCYSVTYTTNNSGEHLITIFINGMLLKGSPFSVNVLDNNSEAVLSTVTTTSCIISQSNEDADSLLQFVNSSPSFEVSVSSSSSGTKRPAEARPDDIIESEDSPKKFKLEPNDFESLPDQLFATSPDVVRVKQENTVDKLTFPRNCCLATHSAIIVKEISSPSHGIQESTVEPVSERPVIEEQSLPLDTNFLTDNLEEISNVQNFKVKFPDSVLLNDHVTESNAANYLKLDSPEFSVHHFNDTKPSMDDESIVCDPQIHNFPYKMNTPEHKFALESESPSTDSAEKDFTQRKTVSSHNSGENVADENSLENHLSEINDDKPFEVTMAPVQNLDDIDMKNSSTAANENKDFVKSKPDENE